MIKQILMIFSIVLLVNHSAISSEQKNNSYKLDFQPKSHSSALIRSFGWTIGPIIAGGGAVLISSTELDFAGVSLSLFGLFAGPCTGLSYAGKRRPYNSAFNRLAIVSIGFVGGIAVWSAFGGEITIFGGPSRDQTSAVTALVVVWTATMILFIKTIVSDFTGLRKHVDDYNNGQWLTSLSIEPTYSPQTKSYGLSLSLSF